MIDFCLESGGVTFEGGHLGAQGGDELVRIDCCLNALLDGSRGVGKAIAVRRSDRCLISREGRR